MTLINFAANTDYPLLQRQKAILVDIATISSLSSEKLEALDGIINFLDAFQDAIVESHIKTEEEVFSHTVIYE